ncbi:MAG: hypothetical protein KAT71_02180 [Gammaproteobacteria bacterium]|nr:hypothetical protein [Gammaproteobacteria bacterium]
MSSKLPHFLGEPPRAYARGSSHCLISHPASHCVLRRTGPKSFVSHCVLRRTGPESFALLTLATQDRIELKSFEKAG